MNSPSRMRSHRKFYQNFIFNFEDIWKRKLYDGFDMLYVPTFMRSWVIVQVE